MTLTSTALLELAFLSDPVLSHDGSRLFCVRTRIEPAEPASDTSDAPDAVPPRYRSEVVEIDLDDGAPTAAERVVARGRNGSERNGVERDGVERPRPSPDGRRLAFLADGPTARHGRQLHLLDLDRGGDARCATNLPGGVHEFVWRPDGRSLAAIGRTERSETDDARVVAREATRLLSKQDGLPAPGVGAPG
ncbi:MAG: hypothetical protein WD336_00235, partial [Trueperaceae bacterium]